MRISSPANSGRTVPLILILILMLSLTFWVTAPGRTDPVSCTMLPLWSPQAQFAGYYMALEKGFYLEHGIDMTILRGGPACSGCDFLQNGRADFAVLWLTTAIRQHGRGLGLVHAGQIVPRSAMMLVSKKSRGIRKPSDMNGKKVSLWGGDLAIPPRAFFWKYGLHVKEVTQSYTVNLFLRDGVDVASAMWYNEYHTILNTGINPDELNIFPMSDYGLNFPEDGIYMLESTYKDNPGLAAACTRASLEGWRYAFDHPEETLDIVITHMRDANICANRTHQKWMLSRMRDLIMPVLDADDGGLLKRSDFDSVSLFLLQTGLIEKIPDFDLFTGAVHAEN